MSSEEINEAALRYHRAYPPGKLAIVATKPMTTQQDLALAYSPGVAAACMAIADDPLEASTVTARGNLVGVISNGTAVLGLGSIGALASKPVMEGKAVLFKKFSGIDVFDIEIEERDPEKFVEIVAGMEPTFGGINLEDIGAPACFIIEKALRERMAIPVFHDDQHGTAIVACSAVINGLRFVGKELGEVTVVTSGAGAAAMACLDLLVNMGLPRENLMMVDRKGVFHSEREDADNEYKARFVRQTDARTLADAVQGADIFLGLSAPGVLTSEMVQTMADKPLILALANPVPEIMPDVAREVRPDAIVATGRSDFPNQVNNVLCFPFIFRGALDVGATTINEEMKIACVRAISDLAMAEPSDVVTRAYGGEPMMFGADYLIPKPFDPRLITEVASAVAKAAMDSGVAKRPIADMDAYRQQLSQFMFRSSAVMEPIFERAREEASRRIIYAEGEDMRVLQAVQQVVDNRIAEPILVGRPDVIEMRLEQMGLSIRLGQDFEVVNPLDDPRYREFWTTYHELMGRRGVSPSEARTVVRTRNTVIAAISIIRGDADGMLCGTEGAFSLHLQDVLDVVGKADGIRDLSTLVALILNRGTYFICDSHVTPDPSAEELAEMTVLSVEEVRRFGITPRVALLSHSNFGTHETESAQKMREAVRILRRRMPDLEVDGEMHADTALSAKIRAHVLPNSALKGDANLLVAPNVDAAHIAYSLLKTVGDGVALGPILVGAAKPVHVLTESISVRGLINMTAMTAVQAQIQAGGGDD